MNRREFLCKLGGGALAASLAVAPFGGVTSKLFAAQTKKSEWPDLVAVRGGEPGALFDKGIEALGGIGSFVRKGQSVLVKPNMGWDVPPEGGANTNPALIKRIVELCVKAGAKSVTIFDHTCDQWQRAYSTSGLERAAKDAGAAVAGAHLESYYQDTKLAAPVLKSAKIHELYLSSDVIINVPILKHHSGAGMTSAMKNLMGVVWDRGAYHRTDLDACIADFCSYKKPTLNVIDAYRVMTTGGPRGIGSSKFIVPKTLILSTDIVAADTAAAMTFGAAPSSFEYIPMAEKNGVGTSKLDNLKIQRIVI